MNLKHLTGLAAPQLTDLALIWPYDPRGGVIAGILPLDEGARRAVVAGGYHVVAAVRQHALYTHVIAAGGQDYLANLVPTAAASPPLGAIPGPSATWRTLRGAATTPAVDVPVPAPTILAARQDADHQEQAWESEGGALAGDARAGVAVNASPGPLPVLAMDRGLPFGGDRPMTGTITDLRPGGFGFIASEAYGTPWHLPFRRAAVDDDGFVDLHVGQRVRFDQESIPGGRGLHAVGVGPLD